jgi:peptidoglycan/xylan/chitin deacetylase (PgdA/CDA1 family)
MTAEKARSIGANELGQIPVLLYHDIGAAGAEPARSPDDFRQDLELLKEEGYFPVNLADMVTGNLDVPAGKTPVVLTFDDSTPGQYRILEDGGLDPQCALGLMDAAVEAGGWAPRATFFLLLDVQPDYNEVFGQPERRQEKLRNLAALGYELGSHTVTHLNLKEASEEEAKRQLAQSKVKIETLAGGGLTVQSLSVPEGEYPEDDALLAQGEFEGDSYAYRAAVEDGGGAAPSPFSEEFRPLHIPRVEVEGDALADLIRTYKEKPELRYVSDGDAAAVSAPEDLAGELGEPVEELGRPLIRY